MARKANRADGLLLYIVMVASILYAGCQNRPPGVTLRAEPAAINAGESSTLSWTSKNAVRVVIEGVGEVGLTGSKTVSPSTTTEFRAKAYDAHGTEAKAQVIVAVQPVYVPPPSPARLSIQSIPPGAQVEIGTRNVGMVSTPGTGRQVGTTPVTVDLRDSDIAVVNGNASITCLLQKAGYFDKFLVLGLGQNGKLEPGRTYSLSANLNRVH